MVEYIYFGEITSCHCFLLSYERHRVHYSTHKISTCVMHIFHTSRENYHKLILNELWSPVFVTISFSSVIQYGLLHISKNGRLYIVDSTEKIARERENVTKNHSDYIEPRACVT